MKMRLKSARKKVVSLLGNLLTTGSRRSLKRECMRTGMIYDKSEPVTQNINKLVFNRLLDFPTFL